MEYYVADFETTVYEGQEDTQVWAAGVIPLEAPDEKEYVTIYHDLKSFMYFLDQRCKYTNVVVFFHNLKFDGSFIMNYLLNSKYWDINAHKTYEGLVFDKAEQYKMPNGTYRYSISDKGQWYTVKLKNHRHTLEFRDSLKLLPFKLEQIGKDFKLKHRKLEMEYTGYRYPGCEITPEEREYIANDVLVIKEALNFMFEQGHDSLTIGSCCLAEYKKEYTKENWNKRFPNLYEIAGDGGEKSVGEWIRKTYKGGWCYVVPEKANKDYKKIGTTCDVNSLYPSMMHSGSGNRYPIGLPTYFEGKIPPEALENDKYYFVHVRTRFYIKENMLPTIQIKGNPMYYSREWLRTSDVKNRDGEYFKYYTKNGELVPAIPDLYLTMTDWELLQKHYDLEDTEIVDGYYFETTMGLFDKYINKYAEIKQNSKGAMRQLAKLFLNNLYGKFATSTDGSYKINFLNDKGEMRSYTMPANDKTPGYIPIGSAITSYARAFTITAAQANYFGPDKPGFIYADTDSIHCDLRPEEIVGAPKHPTAFNHWKYEATWDFARFVRAKTYVEHVIEENEEPIEKPYYNLKCAGMSDHVKQLFLYSVEQNVSRETFEKLDPDEQAFVKEKRTFEDFKVGLCIPGMLKARNIKGGILLVKSPYKMREVIAL